MITCVGFCCCCFCCCCGVEPPLPLDPLPEPPPADGDGDGEGEGDGDGEKPGDGLGLKPGDGESLKFGDPKLALDMISIPLRVDDGGDDDSRYQPREHIRAARILRLAIFSRAGAVIAVLQRAAANGRVCALRCAR